LDILSSTFTTNHTHYGAILDHNYGILNITSSAIASNTSDNGEGILTISSTVNISDCHILDNTREIGIIGFYSLMNITGSTISGHNRGGIRNSIESRMSISDSLISNNMGNAGYSAIVNSHILTITNSTIADNVSTSRGGGIDNSGKLTLIGTTVSGNSSTSYGGGIYNGYGSGPTLIIGSLIVDNYTELGGAGIFNDDGPMTIAESMILSNEVYYGGGGIFSFGVLTVTGSTISGNRAGACGGIQYWVGPSSLRYSEVSNNVAEYSGGGICGGELLSITHSAITGNSASAQGGGISAGWGGVLDIVDSTISDNHAVEKGGSLYIEYGTLTITGTAFISNSASSGGGIYAGDSYWNRPVTITLINSTFTANSADNGGGFYSGDPRSQVTTTLTKSIFVGNSASQWGGGIYMISSTMQVMSSTLLDNSALHGGGIYATNYSQLAISDSTLSGNSASEHGAGIYAITSTLSMTNSTLSANTSGQSGGGIYNHAGLITVTNNTFAGNSALLEGGGLYNSLGLLRTTNSIFLEGASGGSCWGEIIDGGHNIDSGDTCGFDPANGSLPDTDPLLRPLRDNGGPTWTHAMRQNSPVIDAANPLSCPATDQRGAPRPYDGDGDGEPVCDIGSYELDDFVPVSPEGIDIDGASQGESSYTYSFTATVAPISTTLPVTYVWQATGQVPVTHTGGLSDVVTFQWDAVGVKAITVTAGNISGAVSAGHLITITDVPLSGLAAENDSPTWLGDPTTLSATVVGGTNVTYAWDFGDGMNGAGPLVTHTYAAEGVYSALVTATNSTNMLTATTTVTVLLPPEEEKRIYLPLVRK
jgi:predicted outer membrane repeat protein